ncbi:MAG: HYR domain-containing protein [Saprospiraceae bacterium]|nr:HYR domain-containing protein [Saprospiraceae bacterium]
MNRLFLLAFAWVLTHPVFSQNDTLPPVVVCPANDTVIIAPGPCNVPYLYDITVSDDQPGVILSQTAGLPPMDDFPLGNTVNTFTATDAAGNTSTCSFRVSIVHEAYTIDCPEYLEIHLSSDSCSFVATPSFMLDPAYNGCPTAYDFYSYPVGSGPIHPLNFNETDIGKQFNVFMTDTLSLNFPFCVTTIKILGAVPLITCADIEIPCVVPYEQRSPAFLRDSFGFAAGFPTTFDACGDSISLTYLESYLTGDCTTSEYQTIRRTWRATDGEGYTATCVQDINAIKLTLPEVQIPDDVVLDLDCAEAWDSTLWNSFPYVPFQNFHFNVDGAGCNTNSIFSDTVVVPCPGSREVLRRFTVLDWCTATIRQDTQRIALPDPDGPAFSCDSVLVVQTSSPDCTVELTWPTFVLNERCSYATGFSASWVNGTDTIVQNAVVQYGVDTVAQLAVTADFPAGHTVVTFEATDACGVVSSCQTQVQVWDGVTPSVTCDTVATVYLPFEQTLLVTPAQLPVVATDACAQLFYKIRRTQTSACDTAMVWSDALTSCCAESGDTFSVQVRVYDVPPPVGFTDETFGAGQSATCSLRLVVLDTVTLRCVAPPDTVVVCFDLLSDVNQYGGITYPCSVDSMTYLVDVTAYDSVCRRGDIVKKWQVFNALGQTATCEQTIKVTGENRQFAIRFPEDKLTYGCAVAANTAAMGEPVVLDSGCGLLNITYRDTTSMTSIACLQVNRIWTVTDGCFVQSNLPVVYLPNPTPNASLNHFDNNIGPTVSAPGSAAPWTSTVVKINSTDPTPTDFSMFWSDSTGGFTYTQFIRIVDNEVPMIINCPTDTLVFSDTTTNDDLLWNDSIWGGSLARYDKPEDSVQLFQSGTDLCIYNSLRIISRIFLDLDNNGNQETVVSSTHPLPPGQVRYNNNGTMQFGGGTLTSFDNRNVPDSLKYGFVLKVDVDSATRIATGRWYWQSGNNLVDPVLPEGKHQVWWSVEDDCGNEAICATPFVVQDGLAPTLTCRDTVEVIIGADGLGILEAENLLDGAAADNYTPESFIELGIHTGVPTVFPLDANGQPVDSLIFGCYHATNQTVHLWARDEQGNAGFCTTTVKIDPSVHCFFQPITLGGVVKTFNNRGIAGVITTVDTGDPFADVAAPPSDQDGRYAAGFSASGVNFTLIPNKTDLAINGVTTFDLVLINSHILNIQTFDAPYKTIAADANNSKTVTTADIGVLRRLILGILDTLPGQRTWVFVDSAYVFPDPQNPLSAPYPQTKTLINPPGTQLWHNFVGIKIGDVNDNADVDSLVQTVDDRKPLPFILENQYVETGETVSLYFAPKTDVVACQFTLDFPGFECLRFTPDAGITAEHAAIFAEKNKLSFSNDVGGKTGFSLQMRALESGFLSEKINITSDITPAEAWTAAGESLSPQLVFTKNNPTVSLAAQPNIFTDQTVLYYFLPSDTDAALTVYNAAGQLLLQQTVPSTAGEHQFELHASMLNHAVGQLVVQLKTTTEVKTVKMVRQ